MRKIALLTLAIGMLLVGCGQAAPAASPPSTSGPAPQASPAQTAALAATSPARATLTSAPQAPEANTPPPAAPDATPGASPAPGGPGTSVRPPDELVSAAQDRLAKRLGMPADSLMLQSANSKQWPNPGLGCPKQDTVYPEVITDGFLLIFSDRSQSQTYEVHTGATADQMVWCEKNQPTDLSGGAGGSSSAPTAIGDTMQPDAASQPLVDSARQALAKDLGVQDSGIRLIGLEAVEWSDSSLGCPKPGENYLQVITPGYRVTLEAQGQSYEYHTDRTTRVVRCDKS
jgi:hypothetical protein